MYKALKETWYEKEEEVDKEGGIVGDVIETTMYEQLKTTTQDRPSILDCVTKDPGCVSLDDENDMRPESSK